MSSLSSYLYRDHELRTTFRGGNLILTFAARKWGDENGITWLETAPLIDQLPEIDKRKPYPLSWAEQELLFNERSDYNRNLAEFLVNTGLREQEACKLQWDWEIQEPTLGTSVFIIPPNFGGRTTKSGVKNKQPRLVVLNSITKSTIEKQRGIHPTFVFAQDAETSPISRLNNSGWRSARLRASKRYEEKFGKTPSPGFASLRVHDLKHSFGRRLRAAGVGFETRQVLLGHKNGSVTTDYSEAELQELIRAAEKVCGVRTNSPTMSSIASHTESRKTHARGK